MQKNLLQNLGQNKRLVLEVMDQGDSQDGLQIHSSADSYAMSTGYLW